jgi:hypothetical protein
VESELEAMESTEILRGSGATEQEICHRQNCQCKNADQPHLQAGKSGQWRVALGEQGEFSSPQRTRFPTLGYLSLIIFEAQF